MKPATRWFDESFAPVPRFYERFARQQRFGLPSEFPLTLPYPGTDHHLSGPNITTRPGILDRRRIDRVYCPRLSLSMALAEEVKFIQDMSKRLSISQLGQRQASYTFIHARKFYRKALSKLAKMLDSLVRVSRRENATYEIQQQVSKSSEMMLL